MNVKRVIFTFMKKTENILFVRTVRGGLVMIIPVLMIGAFSLIFMSFPIEAYTNFIRSFANGFIYNCLNMLYRATFGMLSTFMTAAFAISYGREHQNRQMSYFDLPITALISFFILSGVFSQNFTIDALGPKGMISAIVAGYFSCSIHVRIEKLFSKSRRLYVDGADLKFNKAVSIILPVAVTCVIFAILNALLHAATDGETFYEFLSRIIKYPFLHSGRSFLNGFLMVLSSSVLWFFGIHGSDCLEGVMAEVFTPAIDINIAAVEAGGVATEILTKQFFDLFVLMGGCGSAICLLIALLVFGKRKADKSLGRFSLLPMLFNINEVMIFGLPVILNPIMLIPFLVTPAVCYLVSYSLMSLGVVGLTVSAVEWTTPVLIGGYLGTGSISGSILQLINIIIGTLIYAPFVILLDKQKQSEASDNYNSLVSLLKTNELERQNLSLTDRGDMCGDIAKMLVLDLRSAIDKGKLVLYYQPQYSADGSCVGVEGLLRWKHDIFGMVYPPLIIKLAEESGFLGELEYLIISDAVENSGNIKSIIGNDVEISINITGETLSAPGLVDFLKSKAETHDLRGLCLEITENFALSFDDNTIKILSDIKALGIRLAIDDFSMGQTSINYLKGNYFDVVKLDGSLVTDIVHNSRCLDIIGSIVGLSHTLGFKVIAEYVENEEQRDALNGAGCTIYQGYLYSPALPMNRIAEKLHSRVK